MNYCELRVGWVGWVGGWEAFFTSVAGASSGPKQHVAACGVDEGGG